MLAVPVVIAGPVTLEDRDLDRVTAGSNDTSGSGGAIIGNSSQATINQTGGVSLSGGAQEGAKALNLVNSAESTVANGVNVWDSAGATEDVDLSVGVSQTNVIDQEQRRSASMPNYSRPEADTLTRTVETGSETHNDVIDRDNTVVDMVSNSRYAKNTSTASVNTLIGGGITETPDDIPEAKVETNAGKGLAVAGQLHSEIDGGEIQLGLAVGGAVSAFKDTDTSDSGFGGMEVGDADSDFTMYGRLILPEITIDINGAGCGVAMGSCNSGGTSEEDTVDLRDNSLIDTEVTNTVGTSEFANETTQAYRSAFELSNAQAEYIVVDDSSLDVSTTFNLVLADSAQSNVRGMNVVNATGSAVADGVNVARTTNYNGGQLGLTQSNVISHSR
jgi:hypothetical protein